MAGHPLEGWKTNRGPGAAAAAPLPGEPMGDGTQKRRKTDSLPTRRIEEAATGPRPRGDATTRPGAKGHTPALIVPVCNLETFYAAIAYGADGVRVGLQKLDPSRPGMGLEELDVAVDIDNGGAPQLGGAASGRRYTQDILSLAGYGTFIWDFWNAFTLDG